MNSKEKKKIENPEPEAEKTELSLEDLEIVSGTGEFDAVPTVEEGDYDQNIKGRI